MADTQEQGTTPTAGQGTEKIGHRTEKIGLVTSTKMDKTICRARRY